MAERRRAPVRNRLRQPRNSSLRILQWGYGRLALRRRFCTGSVRRIARARTRGRQKHLSRSIEAFIAGGRTPGIAGLDSVENARPSAQIRSLEPPVSSQGQLAISAPKRFSAPKRTNARSDARLPASLHVDPPFSGGQTRGRSHLRRQISGDFHACANFDDDRNIPGHEPNSSSFSPCGVIPIPRPCN